MTTITYELHQIDSEGVWQRIYQNQSFMTARANLALELSEPTQKERWKVLRVETQIQEFEEDLSKFIQP